jgi:hypothetical protein
VRLPCLSYETKTNRKKLVNAFSTASPLTAICFLTDPEDFVAVSSIRKVLVFNSELVPIKTTRTTQGVQVLLAKKGSTMTSLKRLGETAIIEPNYYRAKTLPAVGTYLKESTLENRKLAWMAFNHGQSALCPLIQGNQVPTPFVPAAQSGCSACTCQHHLVPDRTQSAERRTRPG